jgi:uncharacterized protein DUF222
MFEHLDDYALTEVIAAEARASAVADARKYGAIAELERRRNTVERANWACDGWDAAAAEIAAALNMSHGRACGEMELAVTLRDRLPKLAALFLAGDVNARRVWLIDQRTRLVTDAEALAAIDTVIADHLTTWGPLSEYKLTQAIDVWVDAIDPGALRRTRESARSRDFNIGDNRNTGTTPVWGRLFSTDAALLGRRLDAMARMVCEDDPRTLPQRRADALGALAAGATALSCQCGRSDCSAAVDDGRASGIVVHVVAEQASLEAQPDAQLHGEAPAPDPLLAENVSRGVELRPVTSARPRPHRTLMMSANCIKAERAPNDAVVTERNKPPP